MTSALYRVNVRYRAADGIEIEISYGWPTAAEALECLDRQAKDPSCISANYLDPTAPAKKATGESE